MGNSYNSAVSICDGLLDCAESMSEALLLGTQTQWGKIVAITTQGGERYYMMQQGNLTSLMPADVVE